MLGIHTKMFLYLTSVVVCCMFMIKTIASEQKLTRSNYEQIYRIRLNGQIEDLRKPLNKLEQTLHHLKYRKETITNELERLKKEPFLSYHMEKNFSAVYRQPHTSKAVLNLSGLRYYLAYGFLPISATITALYAINEWANTENNDKKIAELEKDLQPLLTETQEIEQKINTQAPEIKKKIAELETEKKELKQLDNFISDYKPIWEQ